MERLAIGVELKETYYRQAVRNIEAALKGDINEDVSDDIDDSEAGEEEADFAEPEEVTAG